jgi:hypothetical protein
MSKESEVVYKNLVEEKKILPKDDDEIDSEITISSPNTIISEKIGRLEFRLKEVELFSKICIFLLGCVSLTQGHIFPLLVIVAFLFVTMLG